MSIKRFSVSELHSERHSWHKTFQNAHTHKNTHITQELHPFQSPPLTPTTHSVSDDVIYHSLCSTATEKWFVQQVCTCACVSVKLMRSRSIFWAWCHLSLTNPPWTRWTNRTPKGGKEESTGGKRRTENGVRVCVCVCVCTCTEQNLCPLALTLLLRAHYLMCEVFNYTHTQHLLNYRNTNSSPVCLSN